MVICFWATDSAVCVVDQAEPAESRKSKRAGGTLSLRSLLHKMEDSTLQPTQLPALQPEPCGPSPLQAKEREARASRRQPSRVTGKEAGQLLKDN